MFTLRLAQQPHELGGTSCQATMPRLANMQDHRQGAATWTLHLGWDEHVRMIRCCMSGLIRVKTYMRHVSGICMCQLSERRMCTTSTLTHARVPAGSLRWRCPVAHRALPSPCRLCTRRSWLPGASWALWRPMGCLGRPGGARVRALHCWQPGGARLFTAHGWCGCRWALSAARCVD